MVQKDGFRSTDVYDYLAKKGLIEQDRHNGLHFRKFLNKLRKNDLLKLIPQCQWKPSAHSEMNEWYFYRTGKTISSHTVTDKSIQNSKSIIMPSISETEIDELITKYKPIVKNLPSRTDKKYTLQEQDTRKKYLRAYEYWSDEEVKLLRDFYLLIKRIDKTAILLDRQPSMVEYRLRTLGFLKD